MFYGGRNEPGTAEGVVVCLRRKLPLFGRPGGDLGPGMEPESLEDPGNVVFGGALGDRELFRYLAVGQPSPDEQSDLSLAGGEPFARFVGWWLRLLLLEHSHERWRLGLFF